MRFLANAMGRRLARGALAGAAGAAALVPVDGWERMALGRAPAFDLQTIERRLAVRLWGREPRGLLGRAWKWSLRLTYCAGLGALLSAADLPFLVSVPAIAGFERWALPATGATAPWPTWSRRERALLWIHVAAFVSWMELLIPARES